MKLKDKNVIKLSDLNKDLQLKLRQTPYEIENSPRTNRQSYVLVKKTLIIDGETYIAELQIGNCDIRQSPEHYYDDIIGVFFDSITGDDINPRIYARDKANDMYCTMDLDECYVTLIKKDSVQNEL